MLLRVLRRQVEPAACLPVGAQSAAAAAAAGGGGET